MIQSSHPPSSNMQETNRNSVLITFAKSPLVSFANRSKFVYRNIVQTRPSLPHTPSRRAPYASAVAERTVRVHEDPNDVEHLAHAIASAFEIDPVTRHFHGSSEQSAFEKQLIFSRAVLRAELLRPKGQSTVHVADNGASVAIWHYVGHWKMGGMYSIRLLIGLGRSFGWRAFMCMKSIQAVEEAHPSQPHMHLFIIGTHKDQQGKGYGSTVISEMLRRCDEQVLPAYLESSNERNLTFYQRHGFKVLQKVPGLQPGFPPIYALWRDPRPIHRLPKQCY